MIGLFVSLVFIGFIYFFGLEFSKEVFASAALLGGAVTFLVTPLLLCLSLISLQKTEKNFSPNALCLCFGDLQFKITLGYLIIFVIGSIVLAFVPTSLVYLWIVAFGVAVDRLVHFPMFVIRYSDPESIASQFVKKVRLAAEAGNQRQFTKHVDHLTEIGLRALDRVSPSLCIEIIRHFETIAKGDFWERGPDLSFYIISLISERLEQLWRIADELQMDSVCSAVMVTLGKITSLTASHNPKLAMLSLHLMGTLTKRAQEGERPDASVKASILFTELAKGMLEDPKIFQAEIGDLYYSLIGQLEDISKRTFSQNKNTPVELLVSPFHDLKELFRGEQFIKHPDAQAIINELDRVLGEFEALGLVLAKMPNIPGYVPPKDL